MHLQKHSTRQTICFCKQYGYNVFNKAHNGKEVKVKKFLNMVESLDFIKPISEFTHEKRTSLYSQKQII